MACVIDQERWTYHRDVDATEGLHFNVARKAIKTFVRGFSCNWAK